VKPPLVYPKWECIFILFTRTCMLHYEFCIGNRKKAADVEFAPKNLVTSQ
jgi:hypothetical protein